MIFGCGYVGRALACRLLREGVRVGALTRNAETADELSALGLDPVITGDLDSTEWATKLEGDWPAVVNCVSSAGNGLEGYRKSYIDGQQAILDWAGKRRLSRYLYTSSTSVYPQEGGLVSEDADTSAAGPGGQLLLEAERLLVNASAGMDRHYILRLSGIYGPGRHHLLDQVRAGAVIPGRGDYTLNIIHLHDIVEVMVRLLAVDAPAPSGIYNLSDDMPAHKATVMAWLADQLGVAAPVFDPSQVSPRLARRGGRMPDRVIANGKIRQALNWAPHFPDFQAGYTALFED